MPTSDDAWWPNPWPPRNGPYDGTPYPNDWTDPFINLRAAAPNPFASAPAPFSAAQLGAKAWHPPLFPGDWSAFVPSLFSTAAWPQQSNPPAAPTSAFDSTTAPGWPYPLSILAQLAQFASPVAPRSSDIPSGLFSRDPSILAGGLFGSDPDPTSPFAGAPSGAGGRAAVPMPGMPAGASALGLPAPQSPFPPLAQLQSPFAAGGPALDSSNSLSPGPADGSETPPGRSVLFNRPQPTLDLDSLLLKRVRDAATLDSIAQDLGPTELPLSKSGAPFVSPAPQLSIAPPSIEPMQWLDLARFLSPNLVDYFTKTPPPSPPFPSTPGKIPSEDNPYAAGAAFEAATWLLSGLERGIVGPLGRVANAVEKSAAEAALQAARTATDAPALTRVAERIVTGPYGKLRGTLLPGFQANHLNQNAVYEGIIPENEGLSLAMRGNIITEPGTPHHNYHRSLEQFWDQYRSGGSLEREMPTNADYGEAVRRALIAAGSSPAQASDFAGQAAAQRAAYKLSESAAVPRVPAAIWRRRRD
jgi:hypothetical protein